MTLILTKANYWDKNERLGLKSHNNEMPENNTARKQIAEVLEREV